MEKDKNRIERESAQRAHRDAEELASKAKKEGVEPEPGGNADKEAIAAEAMRRHRRLTELGLKSGETVLVKTEHGQKEGVVDSVDEQMGRVWVMGVDERSVVVDGEQDVYPGNPVLYSPFDIHRLPTETDGKMEKPADS
jgi:hypothetical protein